MSKKDESVNDKIIGLLAMAFSDFPKSRVTAVVLDSKDHPDFHGTASFVYRTSIGDVTVHRGLHSTVIFE